MRNLIQRLKKSGWNKRDIKRAVDIINESKQNKTLDVKFLDKRIYWILLVIIIAANFAISIALIPVLITLKYTQLYFVVAVLGIVFGLLFELVIRSIEHLERYHHILFVILIPIIAFINLFIISKISYKVANNLGLSNVGNSVIVSVIYACSFTVPYLIYRFVLKIEYYAKE